MWSKDRDLAVYEPALFGQWKIGQQKQAGGSNGTLAGTAFSASGSDFAQAGIVGGQMIYLASLDGSLDGAFEIVAVASPTQLTVSALRADADQPPMPIGAASGLIWRVYHFWPQRAAGHQFLRWRLKLNAAAADALDAACLDGLRAAETFCALALIFEALCQQDEQMELFEHKKQTYWQMLDQTLDELELTSGGKAVWRGQSAQMERK